MTGAERSKLKRAIYQTFEDRFELSGPFAQLVRTQVNRALFNLGMNNLPGVISNLRNLVLVYEQWLKFRQSVPELDESIPICISRDEAVTPPRKLLAICIRMQQRDTQIGR